MMNYFAPMDPTSSYFLINWTLILMPLLSVAPPFMKPSRYYSLTFNVLKLLTKEISPIIKLINTPSFMVFFLSIFLSIFLLNFMSLFPYTFTPTSHMSLNLPLSFSFWLTLILYAWIKNTNSMLIHLTPENTPPPLIPFMVIIEIISQMIRPLTLSVRLTTNMIAGHLMMILLSSMMSLLPSTTMIIMLIPLLILILLETSMAIIQAYIFMILLTLYSKEIN